MSTRIILAVLFGATAALVWPSGRCQAEPADAGWQAAAGEQVYRAMAEPEIFLTGRLEAAPQRRGVAGARRAFLDDNGRRVLLHGLGDPGELLGKQVDLRCKALDGLVAEQTASAWVGWVRPARAGEAWRGHRWPRRGERREAAWQAVDGERDDYKRLGGEESVLAGTLRREQVTRVDKQGRRVGGRWGVEIVVPVEVKVDQYVLKAEGADVVCEGDKDALAGFVDKAVELRGKKVIRDGRAVTVVGWVRPREADAGPPWQCVGGDKEPYLKLPGPERELAGELAVDQRVVRPQAGQRIGDMDLVGYLVRVYVLQAEQGQAVLAGDRDVLEKLVGRSVEVRGKPAQTQAGAALAVGWLRVSPDERPAEAGQGRYSRNNDYTRLAGRLERVDVEGGYWKVRFIDPADRAADRDRHRGQFILGNPPVLRDYRDGDWVEITGRVAPNQPNIWIAGTVYELRSIQRQ